ncbi:siderophore-interacting protein [Aliagarivorans taiwanensis]|uniref:siderophore-interacting protein n=1 Tax=Aliagarivorans taiwanensis TaxID=561966 RepID=UPI0004239BC6|nr:siderophore-interacting protein [Aliagarivorans taiwanensis]
MNDTKQQRSKPSPKRLTVLELIDISPNLRRVVLGGDDIAKFPEGCAGDYVKLMFTAEGSSDLSQLPAGAKPAMRTYTISEFDSKQQHLSIDMVLHHQRNMTSDMKSETGLAAHWAANVAVGSEIMVGGPGQSAGIDKQVAQGVFVADMTALPALKQLVAKGHITEQAQLLIEVNSEQDKQALELPEGISVQWVLRESETSLSDALFKLVWPEQEFVVWCACEFGNMRRIRALAAAQAGFQQRASYFSSYWKIGVSEEGHKLAKRQDAEQQSQQAGKTA